MNFARKIPVQKRYWLIYAGLKFVYMLMALFVYSRFTKLGDTVRYLGAYGGYLNGDTLYNSTSMMDTVAHSFYLLLGPVFANLPFLLMSLYGLHYAISRMHLSNHQLRTLLLLLSMPSFCIWTSIASKESVAVFYMGIMLGYIFELLNKEKITNRAVVVLAFYLCAVFKPQYLAGVLSLLIFMQIYFRLRLGALGAIFLFVLFLASSGIAMYIFRFQISELSMVIPSHFSVDSGSTRDNDIWIEEFDIFWSAPYGMFISFFGPTLSEALSKPTHMFAFLESAVILAVFFYYSFLWVLVSIKRNEFYPFYVLLFGCCMLWLLFVSYPFGALNPGSAVRYRENFYSFLVILFFYSYFRATGKLKLPPQTRRKALNFDIPQRASPRLFMGSHQG